MPSGLMLGGIMFHGLLPSRLMHGGLQQYILTSSKLIPGGPTFSELMLDWIMFSEITRPRTS